MGFKEIVLGSDWKNKTKVEKVARISQVADVGTIFLTLIFGGIAPALASNLIAASIGTYTGAEVLKPKKKKK